MVDLRLTEGEHDLRQHILLRRYDREFAVETLRFVKDAREQKLASRGLGPETTRQIDAQIRDIERDPRERP
ncbi:hypothetical protein DVB88_00295 [Tsukamurella pulmonis]|nr:hypothetical protein DVB88_00295 [Tsukamurella pulmonis]